MHNERIVTELQSIIADTLKEIEGERLVSKYLSKQEFKRAPMALIASGKAAVSMAGGAQRFLGERGLLPRRSLVITKYGHDDGTLRLPQLLLIESAHPVPDKQSLYAGEQLIKLCQWARQETGSKSTDAGGAATQMLEVGRQETGNQFKGANSSGSNAAARQAGTESDWMLCLISGGSSALVERLREGVSLAELQEVNKQLLGSGQDIAAMNRRRKQMSLLKDGGLAGELPKIPITALYLSDVPLNDPAVIGSGLLAGKHRNITHCILADNAYARRQAAAKARQLGYEVVCHDELVAGSVEQAAAEMFSAMSGARGKLHIWGGEPVVTLPKDAGLGGRNQHLCLLMAKYIIAEQLSNGAFASVGTDGSDGFTDYAGAIIDCKRAAMIDDLDAAISKADSTPALAKARATLKTGPSGSNLMDLMLGIIS